MDMEKTETQKPGIKARGFGGSENNGESHRKNAVKRKLRYMKNVVIRAELYRERGRMNPPDFHERLKALSLGTA